MHLPDRRYCTLHFLKQILSGKKLFYTNEQIRKVIVPRFKQLTFDRVMEYARTRPGILRYLPDPEDKRNEILIDRQFLFTIVNTIEPYYFPK